MIVSTYYPFYLINLKMECETQNITSYIFRLKPGPLLQRSNVDTYVPIDLSIPQLKTMMTMIMIWLIVCIDFFTIQYFIDLSTSKTGLETVLGSLNVFMHMRSPNYTHRLEFLPSFSLVPLQLKDRIEKVRQKVDFQISDSLSVGIELGSLAWWVCALPTILCVHSLHHGSKDPFIN